jgi:hypothetical protein
MSDGAIAALQIGLFATLALICLAVSMAARGRDWLPSVVASAAMLSFWAVNNALWILAAIQDWSLDTDAAFAGLAVILCIAFRRIWMLVLAILSGASVLLDLAVRVQPVDYALWAWASNGVFVGQLIAASFPGWMALVTRQGSRSPIEPETMA